MKKGKKLIMNKKQDDLEKLKAFHTLTKYHSESEKKWSLMILILIIANMNAV